MSNYDNMMIILPTTIEDAMVNEYIIGKCIQNMSDVKIGELKIIHRMMFSFEYFEPQHLYILTDNKIEDHKKGTWVYEEDNNIPIYEFTYDMKTYPLHQITASTDKTLGLPDITEDFLRGYCSK